MKIYSYKLYEKGQSPKRKRKEVCRNVHKRDDRESIQYRENKYNSLVEVFMSGGM